MSEIILFGGTFEGRKLAEYCVRHEVDALACVVSGYGRDMLPESPFLKICEEALDASHMEELIRREHPALVLDATHPYAGEATANIRTACEKAAVRYERVARLQAGVEGPGESHPEDDRLAGRLAGNFVDLKKGQLAGNTGVLEKSQPEERGSAKSGNTVWVDSAEQAVDYLQNTEGRILVTAGSRRLHCFQKLKHWEERVYARVLPDSQVLKLCEDMGFARGHIMALQGPFSVEMNLALLRAVRADYLVTKESGQAGGFQEKIDAAALAGVTVVVIGRPVREQGISLREAYRLLRPYGKPGKRRLVLVGIGMGGSGQLTLQAEQELREAEAVAGAARMLKSVENYLTGKEIFQSYQSGQILDWIEEREEFSRFAVVYSGDVGFYSGAGQMAEEIRRRGTDLKGEIEVQMIPGISALSYLCAKRMIPWQDVCAVSAHGREPDVAEYLRNHEKVFLLLGGSLTAGEICRRLAENGFGRAEVTVGIRLSYEDEEIVTGKAGELADGGFDGLCAVLIEREKPYEG